MQVILLDKIGKLGDLGDTVNVKAGYGRNFLLPAGKAMLATKETRIRVKGDSLRRSSHLVRDRAASHTSARHH